MKNLHGKYMLQIRLQIHYNDLTKFQILYKSIFM